MDITLILKIAGIGILVSVACQILSRSGRDDQSTFVSIAGIIIVIFIMGSLKVLKILLLMSV